MTLPRLLLLAALLSLSTAGLAQQESVLRDAGDVPLQLADDNDAQDTRVYIVQLRSPSAAERQAALTRIPAKFQKESAAAKDAIAQIQRPEDQQE